MFKNITLEMSAKPFKQLDDAYIQEVCRSLFEQWRPLLKTADCVSVLLWVADGSELLDYKGDMEESFEWAYLIGCANKPSFMKRIDPEGITIFSRPRKYIEHPPKFTYATLKKIVSVLKETGKAVFPEKTIRVGEAFDPGPEFAYSDFKYNRHREICLGNAMGQASMICSYATFKGDHVSYAAFPDGIPDGLSFGTFFGRQANVFLKDMGFDYIWFSNGLGFGKDAWSTTGAVFDGHRFYPENAEGVKELALAFWRDFRAGCPDYPVETRGTNMSMGIDYATDGIPLKSIYRGNFRMLPPANSPWAALNGDFGLELMGHLSRIAELPDDRYLFRFYLHDPWYANSPWYDRYNGCPHDIYLPLALSRIDGNGKIGLPTQFSILTVDNSFGDMPDSCANEAIPHILKAVKESPDAPAPLVWVYPFDEYADASDEQAIRNMFFGDWYIRSAVNAGVPLATVVSTGNFVKTDKRLYRAGVLVSFVPEAGGEFEKQILSYVKDGGRVIFIGNTVNASPAFKELIGVTDADGVFGELPLTVNGKPAGVIKHDPVLSAGEINTVEARKTGFAFAGNRVVGTRGDGFVWLRGTNSNEYRVGSSLLVPHDEKQFFHAERLMLNALEHFGFSLGYERETNGKNPVVMIHRHDGAYMFSVFNRDTTVKCRWRLPLGAPVLDGYTVNIEDGVTVYQFPKAEHRECRVFVVQNAGKIDCCELPPISCVYRRRIRVSGLENATVRILPEAYCRDSMQVLLNTPTQNDFHLVGEDFDGGFVNIDGETVFEARNVTGTLTISMPVKKSFQSWE